MWRTATSARAGTYSRGGIMMNMVLLWAAVATLGCVACQEPMGRADGVLEAAFGGMTASALVVSDPGSSAGVGRRLAGL